MSVEQLQLELQNLKAYKRERVRLGTIAVQEHLLEQLIGYCHPESGVSHQACWALEQSFLLFEQACYAHLAPISHLFTLPVNSSGMRVLTNIASILAKKYYSKKEHPIKNILTLEMRTNMIEGCFQSLIDHEGLTANLAYATRALFEFGKEFDWIYGELAPMIQQHLDHNPTAGYKGLGPAILSKITSSKP